MKQSCLARQCMAVSCNNMRFDPLATRVLRESDPIWRTGTHEFGLQTRELRDGNQLRENFFYPHARKIRTRKCLSGSAYRRNCTGCRHRVMQIDKSLQPVLPHTAQCIICKTERPNQLAPPGVPPPDDGVIPTEQLMECVQCWEIVHPDCFVVAHPEFKVIRAFSCVERIFHVWLRVDPPSRPIVFYFDLFARLVFFRVDFDSGFSSHLVSSFWSIAFLESSVDFQSAFDHSFPRVLHDPA